MINRKLLLPAVLILAAGLMFDCGKKLTDEELLAKATEFNSREEFAKAVEVHEKLMEEYPDSPHYAKSLFMVGFIYANHLKELDKAEKVLKEFLQKYPDDELAPSVKWELEHLGQDDVSEIIQQGENPQ